MGLAIHPEQAAIGIGHRQRVEVGIPGALKPAQRQYHAEFLGQRRKALEHATLAILLGQGQVLVVLFDAEVRGGEQLLQQDQLRALGCGLTHQALGLVKVLVKVPAAGELGGGDSQSAHHFTPAAARPAVAG